MAVFIRNGGTSLTGKWIKAWFVHVPQLFAQKFSDLASAKDYCKRMGFKGKWVRSMPKVGPRGRKVTTYTLEKKDAV